MLLEKETFICLDCESTGLDTEVDRIIEIAYVKFTFSEMLDKFETLINPEKAIPELSQGIHNISDEMVVGKPIIKDVLKDFLTKVQNHIIVGHGIGFDIDLISNEASRNNIPCAIRSCNIIDTLRLARLYGESPINSLEMLRIHFNIPEEGAHRAMNDVMVNIEVFKRLTTSFTTTKQLFNRLEKPISLKAMPLGKHKGRSFSEIPFEYLQWAANKDFDQDLLYSIRLELKNRKRQNSFESASNPFSSL